METLFDSKYVEYLASIVYYEGVTESHTKLLNMLHQLYFIPYSDDINRVGDALSYRLAFEKISGEKAIGDLGRCSILELMVSLATKCEGVLSRASEGDRTYVWFWAMVDSLGLSDCDDYMFSSLRVQTAVQNFNNREYDSTGIGGLFTVPTTAKDFTMCSLWYQMNAYCNYIIALEYDERKKGLYG